MTKMLQKKFVTTAMAAVTILLVVLLGTINALNYGMSARQTDRTLVMLLDNEGSFPPADEKRPEQNGKRLLDPPMDADTAMSTRYFLVFLDQSETVVRTDVTRIASVDDADAEEMAQEVLKNGKKDGKITHFSYRMAETADGRGSLLVFLDTASQLRSALLVLFISIFIGVLCWVFMLFLLIMLSKRAIRPIAENMEKQKQFITNAGHEIKTPLAIILANTDAMELHNGENKWSRNIRSQTVRLSGLMQNLLTLARMEEMETQKDRSPYTGFSMSRLLAETLHPYYEAAALKNVSIREEIAPDVEIYAGRENIIQLFSILFDNAVKYVNDGGYIEVSLKRSGREICMQVKNSCEKLPDVEPEKLFERFFRGDAARTQKNGGYGIGLSVARAIALAHGGTLAASYEKENIICFTLKLKETGDQMRPGAGQKT